jgi:glycine oxidase
VRGQILALEHAELRLDRVIYTERGYLVPRIDGRILVGSTMERAGYDARPTVAGAASLLALARQVAPGLESATIQGLWAGLRPASPDGLPVIGPAGAPWPSGLYFATGHYRNGVLLAPVTARLLTESITTGKTSIPLVPFAASRFLR